MGAVLTMTIDRPATRHPSLPTKMCRGSAGPFVGCTTRPDAAGTRHGERDMRYAMLICMDPEATEADGAAAPPIDGWFDYAIARGEYIQGVRLQPKEDATTVRVRDGKVLVTDGPFTESKEWLAGFAILECADLDDAIELA